MRRVITLNCEACGKPLGLIQNLFNRTVHDYCRETHGYIGHFGLTDWWFSEFNEEERQYVELAFQPLGVQIRIGPDETNADRDSLLTGSAYLVVHGRAGSFLANLAEWLNNPEGRHLARRIVEHAEKIAEDPLEKHDVYQVMIVVYYRDRAKSSQYLAAAVSACQRQIAIAPIVIQEWKKERRRAPCAHNGFEQLAVIEEKRGNYCEALRLSGEALRQGWEPRSVWENRIQRCRRRLARPAKRAGRDSV